MHTFILRARILLYQGLKFFNFHYPKLVQKNWIIFFLLKDFNHLIKQESELILDFFERSEESLSFS